MVVTDLTTHKGIFCQIDNDFEISLKNKKS